MIRMEDKTQSAEGADADADVKSQRLSTPYNNEQGDANKEGVKEDKSDSSDHVEAEKPR